MHELVERRWRKFGQDRIYVVTPNGYTVGHIDLVHRNAHLSAPEFADAFATIVARHVPETQPSDASDLSQRKPGTSLANARRGVAGWNLGEEGERRVGDELRRLPDGWYTVHSVPIGTHGSDIDHVVVGPGGTFAVNTKCHLDATIAVYRNAVYVNNFRQPYIRNSDFEARRTAELLSAASGTTVNVRPILAFVGVHSLIVKQAPDDVVALGRRQLLAWLQSRPTVLNSDQVATIFHEMRKASTWQPASLPTTHMVGA